MENQTSIELEDSAGVFACALSLWTAGRLWSDSHSSGSLSAIFSGRDQFMREVMRIGHVFENWSCRNIEFQELTESWPYMLEERFGQACLAVMPISELPAFGDIHCQSVSSLLQLPVKSGGTLRDPPSSDISMWKENP